MNKKKGFTLIELLAVVIILAIVALVAVPIVIGIIDSVQRKAFMSSVEGIVRAADLYYAENILELNQYFSDYDELVFTFNKEEEKYGETSSGEVLRYDGEKPIGGELILHKHGMLEIVNLTNGVYYANKDVDTEIVYSETDSTLTRSELQDIVEGLQSQMVSMQQQMDNLKQENQALKDKDVELTNADNGLVSKYDELVNVDNDLTNKYNILESKNSMLENSLKNIDVLNQTYPVGSIYISTTSTNPATLFGGTWESYGTGRTLVGVDSSNSNFSTVNKTGGSSTINLAHSHTVNSHTHTTKGHVLTIAEMPSHNHLSFDRESYRYYGMDWGTGDSFSAASSPQKPFLYNYTGNTGGNQAHNHGDTGASSPGTSSSLSSTQSILQPYITVYMWKRVK